ncbi:antibiotic biosynthesis monooxygenase [Sphingomonas sp. LB-2]|uniref:putative quinol monooxygenase n=1 Tax=Sphingomonas caeni TaxID=2984949 RepID=UPI002232A760|nr:putative quinol monooxygenase [Sphingomonas caeni]MCW3847266.1 antibiotic biosynthesis monooxygenase [Sphingomonas caeni]
MILIVGTFRVDPARLDAARPAMAEMIEQSRAETGCIAYSYAEDLFDPGLIHVTERWRDRETLAGHFCAPHLLEWRAKWPALGLGERDLKIYHIARIEDF